MLKKGIRELTLLIIIGIAGIFVASISVKSRKTNESSGIEKKRRCGGVCDNSEENEDRNIDTIRISRATRYNPTVDQCDASPFNTADGTYINPSALKRNEIKWCALSWDLMDDAYRRKVRNESWAWRGEFEFGDTITIQSESKPFINGKYVVHDVMNGRYRKSIDILTHQDNMSPRLGVCKDLVILKQN